MGRKTFTAPVWVMLPITLISALFAYVKATTILRVGHWTLLIFVLIFLWPMLVFIETVIYWVIRRRIFDPRQAWVHLFSMIFVFVVFPVIRLRMTGLFTSRNVPVRSTLNHGNFIDFKSQFLIIWGLLILGHVFFVSVLIKAFSKELPAAQEGEESVNLLDDII
jgi:hypothetical protein